MNLGKNIMQDFQPFVDAILADAMDHQDWPDDAVYKISFRTKVAPEQAMGTTRHVYFKTLSAVEYWEADYATWADVSGNYVEYTVYEWVLGPNVIKHNWY